MMPYIIHLGTLASIYILMTMSFNLAVGYTGLVNFGHIGVMGVGGYVSAVLAKTHDVPVGLSILAAMLVSACVGGLLALPARKIKGDYYALVTLGFLFLSTAVFINWDSVTRGTLGIPGVPRPELFSGQESFFILSVVLAALVFFVLDRLVHSPFGRVLEAVRDDEEVAAALGKPVFKVKIVSMVISGAVVGLSGALLAHYVQFIAPNSFWLELLLWSLAGMMIGGLASMQGSVVGILLLFLITEPLRFLSIPSDLIGPVRLMIFMVVLLLIVLFKPKGLLGRAQLDQ